MKDVMVSRGRSGQGFVITPVKGVGPLLAETVFEWNACGLFSDCLIQHALINTRELIFCKNEVVCKVLGC